MNRIKHATSFTIQQPAEVLFPLFSAEGEKLWVPGWDYQDITGSKVMQEDDIFLTRNHDHVSTSAIWLVKRYEPTAFRVQFYKVEPEEKVGIVTVQCSKLGECLTRVDVVYEYIGLSERGNAFIEGFTSDRYESFIGEWRELLLRYFEKKNPNR